jgi:hypothetical protein
MKKTTILFLGLLASAAIQAQTGINKDTSEKGSGEMQTLFNKTVPLDWQAFMDFSWTKFDGKDAFLGGFLQ